MEVKHSSESNVSNADISIRAEALEKLEASKGKEGGEDKSGNEGKENEAVVAKAKSDKEATDKAIADKVESDKKVTDDAAKNVKVKDKKGPNDPDEMRKWTTRTAQENAKLRKEMEAIKEAQDKTYKLLASLSKKSVDYKELAKNPESIQKFIEDERESLTSEYQTQIEQLANQAREKDTLAERIKREYDTENYPEWKRLYPAIVKIAVGPSGQGDPRIDFTKPASDVLDHLYEIALQENPNGTEPVKEVTNEKTFTEAEVKAMVADMVSKERESITSAARENAAKEAQEQLRREAAGGTVASAGKGMGRIPTDHMAAFKKMTLAEQRDWLIAQQQNNQ